MNHIRRLAGPIPVEPVITDLDAHPELWNRYTLRTESYASPHLSVSDIWIRFRRWQEWLELERTCDSRAEAVERFTRDPHDSYWYKCIDVLPNLRTLIFEVMRFVEGERLGGVLITRIPPGGCVEWHKDAGWHPSAYEKIAVQLRSSPEQCFCFEDGTEFTCEPGTVYTFENRVPHKVINRSVDQERITCIICLQRDQRKPRLVEEQDSAVSYPSVEQCHADDTRR